MKGLVVLDENRKLSSVEGVSWKVWHEGMSRKLCCEGVLVLGKGREDGKGATRGVAVLPGAVALVKEDQKRIADGGILEDSLK